MSDPRAELNKLLVSIGPVWLARLRSGATLVVLALLLVVSVRVGFSQVSKPFPESGPPPVCTETDLEDGDPVTTDLVTVSVINAGGPNGLASRTLGDLVEQGFGRGALADAPADTPRVARTQIWTTEGNTAAVRLVRTYLRGQVTLVDREGPEPGLNLVVGTRFEKVVDGRPQVRARAGESTCVPVATDDAPSAAAAP